MEKPKQSNVNHKTSSTLYVSSQNMFGIENHIKPRSTAPTLPLHSPHSPLHINNRLQHPSENKLSARYINNSNTISHSNKNILISKTKCKRKNDHLKFNDENDLLLKTQGTSTLLCSCEKIDLKAIWSSKQKLDIDPYILKRIMPTRNAATSPGLDARKLKNMSTLTFPRSPDSIVINDKTNSSAMSPQSLRNKTNVLSYTTNLLNGSSKTPRSRYSKLLENSKNLSIQNGYPNSSTNPQNSKLINIPVHEEKNMHMFKSQQLSPYITNEVGLKIELRDSANRSTGCLSYIPCDPSEQIMEENNSVFSRQRLLASDKTTAHQNPCIRSTTLLTGDRSNPWVKRTAIDLFTMTPKREQNYWNLESTETNLFNLCGEGHGYISTKDKVHQQSAPSSPLFLTSVTDCFSSAHSLNNEVYQCKSTIPSPNCIQRSYQNSPVGISVSNSSSTVISLSPEFLIQQNRGKSEITNRPDNLSFLSVFNPKLPQSRRSFSSVSDKFHNIRSIRRLSDQTRPNGIRDFEYGYCHINNYNHAQSKFNSTELSKNETDHVVNLDAPDFSKYLDKCEHSIGSLNSSNVVYELSVDTILETTC